MTDDWISHCLKQRTAIKRKRSKPRRGPVKDAAYLDWLRMLPCCVCAAWRVDFATHTQANQSTPTEAAHVGARGLSQKCNDREALPICERHHRTGPLAQHKLGKKFWIYHGLDQQKLIAEYQKRYDEQQWAQGPEWTRRKS